MTLSVTYKTYFTTLRLFYGMNEKMWTGARTAIYCAISSFDFHIIFIFYPSYDKFKA